MKHNNKIILDRSLLSWEWYEDVNAFRLFMHCVLKASPIDTIKRGVNIKKGTLSISANRLSIELAQSVAKIRLSIRKLESTGEITTTANNKFTTITVTNYDSFVLNDEQIDPIKADKRKAQTVDKSSDDLSEFDLVWEIYDRKGNKKTSQLRFSKLTAKQKKLMSIHLPKYIISTPDKRFRKNLESYINLECWNDEILINNPNQWHNPNVGNYQNSMVYDR